MGLRAYWCITGAGASPLFSPHEPTAAAAAATIELTLRRTPQACGFAATRWTLPCLRQALPWLHLRTDAGLCRLLDRLALTRQRARSYIHSPDHDYAAKLACVQAVRMLHTLEPSSVRTLYLDEVTIARQPTLAQAYAVAGRATGQPLARRSTSSATLTRVVATLDHASGQVVFRRASTITVATLVQFYQDVRAAYPHEQRLYIVQDNWPVHYHPDVLVALEAQETRFARRLPPNWPSAPSAAAQKRWGGLHLPIQLVPLPTYASWTNPIEKLWRKLRQDITHLHRWATDLPRLRAEIDQFLAQFAHGSPDLLRYVGLCPG